MTSQLNIVEEIRGSSLLSAGPRQHLKSGAPSSNLDRPRTRDYGCQLNPRIDCSQERR
jgi:hypothetical protein